MGTRKCTLWELLSCDDIERKAKGGNRLEFFKKGKKYLCTDKSTLLKIAVGSKTLHNLLCITAFL